MRREGADGATGSARACLAAGRAGEPDDGLQRVPQTLRLLLAQRLQQRALGGVACQSGLAEDVPTGVGEIDDVAAPVRRVGPADHESFPLERVKQRDHAGAIDAQPLRRLSLRGLFNVVQPAQEWGVRRVNVASGLFTSNAEVIAAIKQAVPDAQVELPTDGGTAQSYLDIGRIREDTGYAPEWGTERAAADYITWLRAGNERWNYQSIGSAGRAVVPPSAAPIASGKGRALGRLRKWA